MQTTKLYVQLYENWDQLEKNSMRQPPSPFPPGISNSFHRGSIDIFWNFTLEDNNAFEIKIKETEKCLGGRALLQVEYFSNRKSYSSPIRIISLISYLMFSCSYPLFNEPQQWCGVISIKCCSLLCIIVTSTVKFNNVFFPCSHTSWEEGITMFK